MLHFTFLCARKLKRTPLKHGESYFKVIYLHSSDILIIIR